MLACLRIIIFAFIGIIAIQRRQWIGWAVMVVFISSNFYFLYGKPGLTYELIKTFSALMVLLYALTRR